MKHVKSSKKPAPRGIYGGICHEKTLFFKNGFQNRFNDAIIEPTEHFFERKGP